MKNDKKEKSVRIFAIILLVVMGLAACANGYMLMDAPDGSKLGMKVSLLDHSPFRDFYIPGLVLFVVLGLGSCAGAVIMATHMPYSVLYLEAEGYAVVIWILVQVAMIRQFHFMQVIIGGMGLLMLVTASAMRKQH